MKSTHVTKISQLGALAMVAALYPGCGNSSDQGDFASLDRGELVSNGFSLNGFSLNGFSLNGFSLNGFSLNGFSLNGFSLNGVSLDNGTFSALTNDGLPLRGLDLIGAQFQVTEQSSDQSQMIYYNIRFDNIYTDTTVPAGDVYLYDVSYSQSGDPTWRSLCLDGDGNPVAAIPIRNAWDVQSGARIDNPNVVTFACVSGALGKCVRLGYRPWAQATRCSEESGACSTVSLADYHQACTRMLRADYCGTGTSYTLNGTLIDVFDRLSPQVQAESANWLMEAKWNSAGATCLGVARHEDLISARRPPDCSRRLPDCGDSHDLPGALLGSTFYSGTSAQARRPSR